MITEQQFETALMALLRTPFSGPNDPGLVQRRLNATFQAVDDPALAVKSYERLTTANSNDALASDFHDPLLTSTRHDLLAALTARRAHLRNRSRGAGITNWWTRTPKPSVP